MADKNIRQAGRIQLVDPNDFQYQTNTSMFGDTNYNMSVPLEDLCIIVDLKTKTKARTILNTTNNKNSTIQVGDNNLNISFIGGTSDKNTANQPFLTTKYTELNTELGQDIDEALGITDINIDFNSSYAPVVNINFVDVRGGGLFQNNAQSKFNVLFRLPYPIFELTVKGYYGKPVKYCLHLIKCNSKFNSQTGNFEIAAQFVGYTYAMLSDMIIGYLKAAEYMPKGLKKAKDRGVMTIYEYMKAVSKIDKTVHDKVLTEDDDDVKNEQAIEEMRPIVSEMESIAKNLIFKITTDSTLKNYPVKSIYVSGIDIHDSIACVDDAGGKFSNGNSPTLTTYVDEYNTKMKDAFDRYNAKANGDTLLTIADIKDVTYVIDPEFASSISSPVSQNNRDIIKNEYSCVDDACVDDKIARLQKANESIINAYNTNNSDNAEVRNYDVTDVLLVLRARKDALDEKESTYQKNLAIKMRDAVFNQLGLHTDIRSTFDVFTTAVEVFLEMLHEVSVSAGDPNNKARYDELSKFATTTATGLDNPKDAFSKNFVYPWPEYHENDVEKYLGARGVLTNPLNVDEIRFTEELYDAMVAVQKAEDELNPINGSGVNAWYSYSPLDSYIFNTDETNPYSRLGDTPNHDDLAKFIVLRAVGHLKYGNRGLSKEEIERLADGEVELINKKFKDKGAIIKALNQTYDDVNKYVAVKGKQQDDTEHYVFNNDGHTDAALIYTYYSENDGKALPVKYKFTSGKDGKMQTNLVAYTAANDGLSETGWDIAGDKFRDDASSFVVLDNKVPKGSELTNGINYEGTSATPPTALDSVLSLQKLQAMNRQTYISSDELVAAGFNVGAGKLGVQEFLNIDYTDASYDTWTTTFKYGIDKTSFYSVFYDNTFVKDLNESDRNINPQAWDEFKTGPLKSTNIGTLPYFVSPSLCKVRDINYKNTFDLSSGTVPVAVMDKNEYSVYQLMSTYAFREAVGNNIGLTKLHEDNVDSDVAFPYLTFGVWRDDNLEDQIPLFGSTFYYSQSKIGKAFLFLHCLPWKGLARQLSRFKDGPVPKPLGSNAGLFNPNEISAILGNRSGFVQVPKLWLIFIGAILKRYRLGNVTNINNFDNLQASAFDFDIDSSQASFTYDPTATHDTIGYDILRWEYQGGGSLLPGMTENPGHQGVVVGGPSVYPKTYQYLRWQESYNVGANIGAFNDPSDISASMCFTDSSSISSQGDGSLAYSKIDETIIRLPRAVQDEFIRLFDEFVSNDWDSIRDVCEIRAAGKETTPSDANNADFINLYKAIANSATINSTGDAGSINASTVATLVGKNGGDLTEKFNIFSVVYNDRTKDSSAKANRFENTIFFEYKDKSQASNKLKEWFFKKTVIANNSYLLWNQKTQIDAQGSTYNNVAGTKSQGQIIVDRDQEFTPYMTKIISGVKATAEKSDKPIKTTEEMDAIKLEIYRHLKKLYDKWIATTNNADEVVFQCCYAGVNKRVSTDDAVNKNRGETAGTTRLLDSFRFIDRAYRDIGNEFQVNPISVNQQLIDSNDISFYDLAGRILTDYNFNFIALPSFIDYNNPDEIKNAFTPYPYYDAVKEAVSGPSFVCVYIGQPSTKLDFGEAGDYPNDGFDLNDPTTWPVDFTNAQKSNGEDLAAAFVVRYGHQNQNIFKDVQLDQAEHNNTAESLKITDNIANNLSQTSRSYFGQNLYDVYSVRSYKVGIEMMGDAMVQPMMYFQLDNIPMFHGAYLITHVKHSIKPNHMLTTFNGTRIKAVATPIIDAQTMYQALINSYGLPAATGNETISNKTSSYEKPIVATIRSNQVSNGSLKDNGCIEFWNIEGGKDGKADTWKLSDVNIKNNISDTPKLLAEAVAPLRAMLKEWTEWMKTNGFKGDSNGNYAFINSASRTIAQQQSVSATHNSASSAGVGTSPHGWGIALDFQFLKKDGSIISNYVPGTQKHNLDEGFNFSINESLVWLINNSYRFGFIIPPLMRDKVGRTEDEFWHFEYNGTSAKCIQNKNPHFYSTEPNSNGIDADMSKAYETNVVKNPIEGGKTCDDANRAVYSDNNCDDVKVSYESTPGDYKEIEYQHDMASRVAVKDYLKSKGFTKEETAAIMGNAETESHFDACQGNIDVNYMFSGGLWAWNNMSKATTTKIYSACSAKPKEADRVPIALAQVKYLVEEDAAFKSWQTKKDNALSEVRNGASASAATDKSDAYIHAYTFAKYFEVCCWCGVFSKGCNGASLDAPNGFLQYIVGGYTYFPGSGQVYQKEYKRSQFANTFMVRFEDPNDVLYWDGKGTNTGKSPIPTTTNSNTNTTTNTTTGGGWPEAIVIGDSLVGNVATGAKKASWVGPAQSEATLHYGGKDLKWLNGALNKADVHPEVKYVIVQIGTNDHFGGKADGTFYAGTTGLVTNLFTLLRQKFPNVVKIMAVKGCWCYGNNRDITTPGGGGDPTIVTNYYSLFSQQGAYIVPTAIGCHYENTPGDPHNYQPVFDTIGGEIDNQIP
jgi:hypothetical protein